MKTLAEILDTLADLPGWEERYEYIIDLGRQLPPFADADRTEANRVRGCTSTVHMTARWDEEGRLALGLTSDALIVNGLLAVAHAAYQGRTREEIAALDLPAALASSGLLEHLSPNRRHGFASVVGRIKSFK